MIPVKINCYICNKLVGYNCGVTTIMNTGDHVFRCKKCNVKHRNKINKK